MRLFVHLCPPIHQSTRQEKAGKSRKGQERTGKKWKAAERGRNGRNSRYCMSFLFGCHCVSRFCMNYPSWRPTQISSIEGKERGGQEGGESRGKGRRE